MVNARYVCNTYLIRRWNPMKKIEKKLKKENVFQINCYKDMLGNIKKDAKQINLKQFSVRKICVRIVESRCVFICGDRKHEHVYMKYNTVFAYVYFIGIAYLSGKFDYFEHKTT